MKLSTQFKSILCLALASLSYVSSLPQMDMGGMTMPMPEPSDPPQTDSNEVVGCLYSASNDRLGNSLLVYDIHSDGTISFNKHYPTGGVGSANQITPEISDALRTEGSVMVHEDRLFHVNAGSDTIQMWSINPADPSELEPIGPPVPSGGNFPGSISVSSKTGQVCVSNGGIINGVQCFTQTDSGLVPIPNTNRIIGFPQTTPPTYNDTLNSMSTCLFSPDGSKLLVDVKGLAQQKLPGYIAAWDVNDDGSLSACRQDFPAPSSVGAINFGMSYFHGTPGDSYIIADPTQGGIVYDMSNGYGPGLWQATNIPIPGEGVVCWVSYASKSDSYFFSDFGAQIVWEVGINSTTKDSRVINSFPLNNITTVNIDHRVVTIGDNQFLYQLAPFGSSIFVFDIQPEGQTHMIQAFNFSEPLTNANVLFSDLSPQGMHFHLKTM